MNKSEEEIPEKTEYELKCEEALEDAELRGFKEGCVYKNTKGDTHVALHDAIVFQPHRDPDEVYLYLGQGHGIIYDGCVWGEVIKKQVIKEEENE